MDDRQQLTQQVLETVRRFVERAVMPVASRYEHDDEYPHDLVERMRERARSRAKAYSWDRITDEYEQLLAGLSGQPLPQRESPVSR